MDGSYRSHGLHANSAPFGPGSSGPAASSYADDEYANYSDALAEAERSDILKLVLYDLNSAIAPKDIRLMAIHAALEEFDHVSFAEVGAPYIFDLQQLTSLFIRTTSPSTTRSWNCAPITSYCKN